MLSPVACDATHASPELPVSKAGSHPCLTYMVYACTPPAREKRKKFSIFTVFTADVGIFFGYYRFYRLLGERKRENFQFVPFLPPAGKGRKNDCLPCLLRIMVKFLIFIVFTICREKEKKSSFPVFTADVDKQK